MVARQPGQRCEAATAYGGAYPAAAIELLLAVGRHLDGDIDVSALEDEALIQRLARYPEVLESAARDREPHQLAYYLRELAYDFHTYYGAHTFLVEDAALRDARLNLVVATRQVLANGLKLLGVSAPESM